jgi:hypothetical protein
MAPPPGFVHYTPCTLPFCPLRQDLVVFKEERKQIAERKKAEEQTQATSPQLGGQLDGNALSFLSRSTRGYDVASNFGESTSDLKDAHNEAEDDGQEATVSLIDPGSRALTGPYSDSDSSESGNDAKAATIEVNVDPQPNNSEPVELNARTSSTTSRNNMDYLDLSEFASPPPSSDTDETPLLSLSHSGTLGKRGRSTSPDEQSKRKSKRAKRELAPDPDSLVSILDRNHPVNNCDQRPSNMPDNPPAPDATPADFSQTLPTRPKLDQQLSELPFLRRRPGDWLMAPTGPRAKLVCFFWYHKGYCIARRSDGHPIPCTHAHNLNMPNPQVSFPKGITDHKLPCPLPLCPVRSTEPKHHDSNVRAREMTEPCVKNQTSTPSRRGTSGNSYNSSPRDGISEARRMLKGPKFNLTSKFKLPVLTGANRERFKTQKRNIEQWQADNGIKSSDGRRQMTVAEKIEAKKIKKQMKREKMKRESRAKSQKGKGPTPLLDYGNATLWTADPNATDVFLDNEKIQGPASPRTKQVEEGILRREKPDLFGADVVIGGRTKTGDTRAELHRHSFRPIAGIITEHKPVHDLREEMEDRHQHAIGVAQLPKDMQTPSTLRPLSMAPSFIDEGEHPENSVNGGRRGTGPKTRGNRKRRVLVDYELPTGDARLDWDTDRVRRLFGEIM